MKTLPRFLASLSLLAGLMATPPATAETHHVKMLNRNAQGAMVYEPDFLKVKPGDVVKFRATTSGHDAASIDGMMPAGAQAFKGKINEEIEVRFTEEGLYGIKCLPHYAMGMVMLIQVGDKADPASLQVPEAVPARARKRFQEIVGRATGQ
ncbi:MAG: pseudoazurin [Lautropia sp.]|nr:pseudoazurin [Lautropia sp.]